MIQSLSRYMWKPPPAAPARVLLDTAIPAPRVMEAEQVLGSRALFPLVCTLLHTTSACVWASWLLGFVIVIRSLVLMTWVCLCELGSLEWLDIRGKRSAVPKSRPACDHLHSV